MNSIYAYIKKYAAMLAAQPYPLGLAARLIVETDEGVFGTVKGADLENLGETEVEKLPLSVLPKGRQGIRSIVISQTPACQEWLRRGQALFPALDDMAQIIGPRAAVIDARKGFQKAVPQLVRIMRTNAGCFMVIGRAPNGTYLGYTLTVGRTPYEAIVAMTVLEKSAEVALLAEKIGSPQPVSAWECRRMRSIYLKKYSKSEASARAAEAAALAAHEDAAAAKTATGAGAADENTDLGTANAADTAALAAPEDAAAAKTATGAGAADEIASAANTATASGSASAADITGGTMQESSPTREETLRAQLVNYGKQLVASGLVQGTWGNLSARLDDTYMLVTPSGLDYARLTPVDMVKVNIRTLEYEGGLKPTSEKSLHAAIYQNRPDIGGIIHTHSKYCCVYAAARRDLPIPADRQTAFQSPIKLAPYAPPGSKALTKNTAAAVGDNYGAIMAGHGMIACGRDLTAAFQNCKQLEAIAEASLQK